MGSRSITRPVPVICTEDRHAGQPGQLSFPRAGPCLSEGGTQMITIVVPLDGSSVAEAVLPCVENLASRLHAEVYFIQAVDMRASLALEQTAIEPALLPHAQLDRDKRVAQDYLSTLAAAWQEKDIDTKWEVVQGPPASTIVEFARTHKAYIIAMSTHGRSGLSRMVFGSVADQVLRQSGIPVLLIKPGHRAR